MQHIEHVRGQSTLMQYKFVIVFSIFEIELHLCKIYTFNLSLYRNWEFNP
jgi:hypothetical protein